MSFCGTWARLYARIFSLNAPSLNFRENVHDFRTSCFSRPQAASMPMWNGRLCQRLSVAVQRFSGVCFTTHLAIFKINFFIIRDTHRVLISLFSILSIALGNEVPRDKIIIIITQTQCWQKTRHHALNDLVWHALSRANMPAVMEPAGLVRSDEKRPDGFTQIHAGKCMT
jgi:hypothetical protein